MAHVQSSLGGNSYPDPVIEAQPTRTNFQVLYLDYMNQPLGFAPDDQSAIDSHDYMVENGLKEEYIQIRRGWLN